jgi:hypothetical protein
VLDLDGELGLELDGEPGLELDGEPGATAAGGCVSDGAGAEMSEVARRFGQPVSNNTRVRREKSAAAVCREFRIEGLLERGLTLTAPVLPLEDSAVSIASPPPRPGPWADEPIQGRHQGGSLCPEFPERVEREPS